MASLKLIGLSYANISPGAIVGDAPSPYAAISMSPNAPTTDYLSTGTLSAGDTGEFGGLSEMTVEFWFSIGGYPAAQRNIMSGPEITGAVRQWGFRINTTGTINFYVRDSTPTLFSITSTTAIKTTVGSPDFGPWYHVVGCVDNVANLLRLFINGTQEASTAWSGTHSIGATTLSATNGDMRVNDSSTDVAYNFDELATYRRYIGSDRIAAHYQAGTQMGLASGSPGQRIIGILDNCASVHAPRSIQAGSRNVLEAYFSAQPPRDELERARSAENVNAMLFVSGEGAITFLDAAHRSSAPYNTDKSIYGDSGSELPYLDCSLDYSDSFIANEWNVTRTTGPGEPGGGDSVGLTQTASDATSIGRYFSRPQDMSDVPVRKDSDASDIATAMLAKYKDPITRVTSLRPNMADPQTALETFRLELADRINFRRTPPGGGFRINQSVYVQSIELSGANDGTPPSCTLGVSPL